MIICISIDLLIDISILAVMNWKKLIIELAEWGWTQAAIADVVQVKQPTIAGILAGEHAEMRWSNGERLRKLHLRESRKHKATS